MISNSKKTGVSIDRLRATNSEAVEEIKRKERDALQRLEGYRREHGKLEVLFDELRQSIVAVQAQPSIYIAAKPKIVVHSPCAACMCINDTHMGSMQSADEIEGFNSYSPAICEKRCMTYCEKVINWTDLHRKSYHIDELRVLVIGDLMCFPAGTPITMWDGSVKNIENIVEGDLVLSDPDPKKVIKVHSRDHKNEESLVEIRLCKIPSITATEGHIVKRLKREWVETGWNPGGKTAKPFIIRDKKTELNRSAIDECPVSDLRIGDYLIVNPYRPTNGKSTIDIRDTTGLEISEENNTLKRKVRGWSPVVVSSNEIEIDNDLLWLLGLFIAEGCYQKGRQGHINSAMFTLNIAEDALEDRITKIVKNKFGYDTTVLKHPKVHTRCVYINNQNIATLIYKLCGKLCTNKKISDIIYTSPRSLLPLVGGWLDGDGGLNKHGQTLVGVTVNQTLARQISTILWSERVAHVVCEDDHGRHRMAYRIGFSGAYAQQLASYTVKYNKHTFKPTYEDGFWLEDCYCVRVMSTILKRATTKLYDLSIEDNHYYQVNGVVVHNSGDIHEELKVTNAFPTPVQCARSGELLAKQISVMSQHFKNVVVEFIVEDNHSRLTKKPQAKEAGINSFNYVVGFIAKEMLRAHKNVQFNMYPQYEAVINVCGRRYLLCHGHGVSGWMGFPYYGIERRIAKEAMKRMNGPDVRKFHRVILGHWHAPMSHPYFWISGSVQGTDAFDHKNGRHAEPSQAAWMVHPKHGEFDRTDFTLND